MTALGYVGRDIPSIFIRVCSLRLGVYIYISSKIEDKQVPGIYVYMYNININIYGTPPKKKKTTFCHVLTVFTVFCNLFGTLNFEANFEGGPYIYMVTPPPMIHPKHFIWELPVFCAHFF